LLRSYFIISFFAILLILIVFIIFNKLIKLSLIIVIVRNKSLAVLKIKEICNKKIYITIASYNL